MCPGFGLGSEELAVVAVFGKELALGGFRFASLPCHVEN